MSRRKPDSTHANKFKERLRANTEAAGLPDTASNRQRIEDATWIDLAMDVTRTAILRGQVVEASQLERLVAARSSILPKTERLTVAYVYMCCGCRSECQRDPAELCAACRAELPPKAKRVPEAAPVKAEVPAPETPAPAASPAPSSQPAPKDNVVPIKKSDTDFAPWRDITGTGRVEGQEPSWSPSGLFKCYGDIPDGF